MTRYEIIQTELRMLQLRQALTVNLPAAVASIFTYQSIDSFGFQLLATLWVFLVTKILLHHIWRIIFPAYRAWTDRSNQISAEISNLQSRITAIFSRYRERQKGEQFKYAYNLCGRSIRDLEEALSVGMHREQREVFVTAFMRAGVAVRVTASIGSPSQCSASDNPVRWKEHAEKLGCDEIRQYHNHPAHNGTTSPSSTDIKASATFKSFLGPYGSRLRSLIICWNGIREWKVFEYDENGRYWLHFEFDAAG